jgi:hypothetical protein
MTSRINRHCAMILTSLCVVFLSARELSAQFPVVTPTAAACESARSALLGGTTELAAAVDLPYCPGGSSAIRSAILASRQVSSAGALSVIYFLSAQVVDDAVAIAAIDVALDGSALEIVRTYALFALAAQANPSAALPSPTESFSGSVTSPCFFAVEASPRADESIPLAPATLLRIHNASLSVYQNASLPVRLRRMALCLQTSLSAVFTPPAVGSAIQLTYLCGNRFRIRNKNFVDVDVRWDVYNTQESSVESIGAASLLVPNFDQQFETIQRGTVRLFFNGALIQTKANGGTTCTTPY